MANCDSNYAGGVWCGFPGDILSASQRNSPDQSEIPPQYDGLHLRGRQGRDYPSTIYRSYPSAMSFAMVISATL